MVRKVVELAVPLMTGRRHDLYDNGGGTIITGKRKRLKLSRNTKTDQVRI
jgi:hypothetical protein